MITAKIIKKTTMFCIVLATLLPPDPPSAQRVLAMPSGLSHGSTLAGVICANAGSARKG